MSREVVVALGGGGARGLAHIGVLGELERAGYRVAGVAGTSIGGVMAAVYAAGKSPAEMAAWAELALRKGLFRFRPSPGGILGIDRIRDVMEAVLGEVRFSETRCPLALTAVNLDSGLEVTLTDGRLVDAVMATIALPGIFPPLGSGVDRLIDGGVLDPVPVLPARRLHRAPVVAVVLSAPPGSPSSSTFGPLSILPAVSVLSRFRLGEALAIFSRSLEITSRMFSDLRLKMDRPDVVVRPAVAHIGILDAPEVGPAVDAGEAAMQEAIPELERWYGVRGALRRLRRSLGLARNG